MPFVAAGVGGLILISVVTLFYKFGSLWIQAFSSGADVSFIGLFGMSLRRVSPSIIVKAKIMACQSGISIDRQTGISTDSLEAHALAGGSVFKVVTAIIAARRAGIDLDFTRAAAIDLAGRDVFEAVQTSVLPKVIDCPDPSAGLRHGNSKTWLSAIAKDGIEMKVHARVTVRTCLDQLIGGATEQTIIARVGQGIISAIGAAESYMDVISEPVVISKRVMERGLDTQTAFEIVSIDIAEIDVGTNIGARLQAEQAEADMRVAEAAAESRKANAIALEQEMRALTAKARAAIVEAESEIPLALSDAFAIGQMHSHDKPKKKKGVVKSHWQAS